jgi:NAD dependent epimerase/dehydratase family enzyme
MQLVLGKNDGVLNKLSPVFNSGSALGSGKQYMPWIHVDDYVQSILKL